MLVMDDKPQHFRSFPSSNHCNIATSIGKPLLYKPAVWVLRCGILNVGLASVLAGSSQTISTIKCIVWAWQQMKKNRIYNTMKKQTGHVQHARPPKNPNPNPQIKRNPHRSDTWHPCWIGRKNMKTSFNPNQRRLQKATGRRAHPVTSDEKQNKNNGPSRSRFWNSPPPEHLYIKWWLFTTL